jgi:RNA-binding motif X-linked protein 2
MNSIRQTAALNKAELDNVTPSSASWHRDYSDTAFIYIGGLDSQLSEGDVITIFSQYGEPVFLNLVRDKETGKSKGFAFLKYEDQRSCDLAVDNLGGATVQGRLLNVDHTRYKRKDDEVIQDNTRSFGEQNAQEGPDSSSRSRREIRGANTDEESDREERRRKRKPLKEEKELEDLIMEDEADEDPMKAYFIKKKKEEVEHARKRHHRRRESRSPRRDRDREDGRYRNSRKESSRNTKDKERSSKHRSRSRERRRRSPSPTSTSHSKSKGTPPSFRRQAIATSLRSRTFTDTNVS